MKTVNYCEKCGLGFFDKDACWDHEKIVAIPLPFMSKMWQSYILGQER